MALTPNLSTGGMPRPRELSTGSGINSGLKMGKLSAPKGLSANGPKLASIKGSMKAPKMGGAKLSSSTLKGLTGLKSSAPKSVLKTPSMSSAIKSIITGSKKLGGGMGSSLGGLGMGGGMAGSSGVGAPGMAPSPSFFGSMNPGAGSPGLGM